MGEIGGEKVRTKLEERLGETGCIKRKIFRLFFSDRRGCGNLNKLQLEDEIFIQAAVGG